MKEKEENNNKSPNWEKREGGAEKTLSLIEEITEYLASYPVVTALVGGLYTAWVYYNGKHWLFYAVTAFIMYSLFTRIEEQQRESDIPVISEDEARKHAREHLDQEIKTGEHAFDRADVGKLKITSYRGEASLETAGTARPQYWEIPLLVNPIGELHRIRVYPYKTPESWRGFILKSGTEEYGFSAFSRRRSNTKTSDINKK